MNSEMNGPNFDGDVRNGQIWLKGRWHALFAREAVVGDIMWFAYTEDSHIALREHYRRWYKDFSFAYGEQWVS